MRFAYLHDLLNSAKVKYESSLINPKINRISLNSKEVQNGTLFLGMTGTKVDGGIYWQEAISNGAEAAIISENAEKITGKVNSSKVLVLKSSLNYTFGQIIAEFWNRPSRKLKLIGVTGTNGKTTVTFLLEFLFNKLGKKAALFGTLFNRWEGYSEISSHTTNSADKLQSNLNLALKSEVEFVILEVSSHAIAQKRISGCEFCGAIFTNLTQDHLDYHLDMENYFETKMKLFCNPYLSQKNGFSVINVDDEWGFKLFNKLNSKTLLSSIKDSFFNKNLENFFYVTNKKLTSSGSSCLLKTPKEEVQLFVPLIGEFNLMNALQAVIVLNQFGFSFNQICKEIKYFPGVPGRMEKVNLCDKETESYLPEVIIDYAHTPDGLEKVLKTLNNFSTGKIIIVFGCGGDRDIKKRSLMGSIAEELSDFVFITSDNPRKEDPLKIIKDILTGIKHKNNTYIELDRFEAIKKAINFATKRDIVLIAGKGHENYQILNERTINFNDKEIAKQLLTEKLNLEK